MATSNPNDTSNPTSEHDDQETSKSKELELKMERRAKRKRQQESNQNWQMLSRLAGITADVEDVAHEATRLRYTWTTPRVLTTDAELTDAQKQQLENDHKNRLKEILFRQCGAALKLIMTNKWAYPFNAPVDTNRFKDYKNFVSQPMDFGTIKTKLDGQKYAHPDEMHADVKLVFGNARKYNPQGSDVWTMASTLEDKFEERWAMSVLPKLGDEKIAQANQEIMAKKKILEQQQQQIFDQLERQRQQLLERLHTLSTYVSDAKSQAAAACTPLTQEEKSQLTRQLAHLPQEHFETALSLVLAHHPDLLPQGNSGDSVINPDHMDALTLRQLQSFIAAVKEAGGALDGPQGGPGEPFEGPSEGDSEGEGAMQPVMWPGLVLGTGRRMLRQRRERMFDGLERMMMHATSHNSLPHVGGVAADGLQGEATETSGGAAQPGMSQDLGGNQRGNQYGGTAPGSPTAPASSFAGHVHEQLQATAGQLQDVLQATHGGKGGKGAMRGAPGDGDPAEGEGMDAEADALLAPP